MDFEILRHCAFSLDGADTGDSRRLDDVVALLRPHSPRRSIPAMTIVTLVSYRIVLAINSTQGPREQRVHRDRFHFVIFDAWKDVTGPAGLRQREV